MARVYRWMRTKRIALAFCALTLLGAVGFWALAADGDPWSWPYEIQEHSSMSRSLSFAEAKADAEAFFGAELKTVGTAGAWGEISSPGTLIDVPLEAFGGPPPPEITVAYDFALYFGTYGAAFERVSVPYYLVFVGEFFAAYAPPPGPVIVQWGSQQAPDPDLSAALAQAFAEMGEQGSVLVMPSAMLRVEHPHVSTWQPTPIDTWRAGANFRYELKAPPNRPPEAVASADPMVALVGQPIQFKGDGSSDPDGDPLTHYWDFGDGGWSNEVNPIHTYNEAKTYTVKLRVHDSNSAEDETSLTIKVIAVDKLVVKPAAVTLLSGGTQQFKAEGTWYGPDGTPDTADDETYDVTSLVSWRVEPREAGAPAPGTITDAGLFTAGIPAGDDRRLRGFVFATLTFDTETREAWAEVDVWEPKLGLEWVDPVKGSRPEAWVHVGHDYTFKARLVYSVKGQKDKPWDFAKYGNATYWWKVTYVPTNTVVFKDTQTNQAVHPSLKLSFSKPGKYSVELQAGARTAPLKPVVHPSAVVHAVRLTPHYGVPGATKVQVTLEGAKFPPKRDEVDFGDDITVDKITNKNTTAEITIAPGAVLGARDLKIGKGKKIITLKNAFWVVKIDIMVNAQDAVSTDDIVCKASSSGAPEEPPAVPVYVKLTPPGAATAARPIALYLEDVLNPAKAKGGISGDVQLRDAAETPIDHITFPGDADPGGVAELLVTGHVKSHRQDDVLLQARAESAAGPVYAKQDMTVLWVEMVGRKKGLRRRPPVYEDARRAWGRTWTQSYGVIIDPSGIGYARAVVEIRGSIHPKDFNVGAIPGAPIREVRSTDAIGAAARVSVGLGFVINRELNGRRFYLDSRVVPKWNFGPGGKAEDDSYLRFQDVTPNVDTLDKDRLVIIDEDGPTSLILHPPKQPPDPENNPRAKDARLRLDFTQWTTFTYKVDGVRTVVRCSNDYKWATRMRIVRRLGNFRSRLWSGGGDNPNDGKGENEILLGKHNKNLNP